MLICFCEDFERGSYHHFGWRGEKLGACLPLNWWRVFPNHSRSEIPHWGSLLLLRTRASGCILTAFGPYVVEVVLDSTSPLHFLFSLEENLKTGPFRSSMGGRTCCGCGCGRCNGCTNNRSRSIEYRNRYPDSRNRCENSRSRDCNRDLEVSPCWGNLLGHWFVQCIFYNNWEWGLWLQISIYYYHAGLMPSEFHIFASILGTIY